MQADMMQDAIRGDVYLGMLAGGPEPRLDATTIERDGQTLLGKPRGRAGTAARGPRHRRALPDRRAGGQDLRR